MYFRTKVNHAKKGQEMHGELEKLEITLVLIEKVLKLMNIFFNL